ncbi:hypothetical protein REPUB_Repub16aG0113400 [Reevesia pubescens]
MGFQGRAEQALSLEKNGLKPFSHGSSSRLPRFDEKFLKDTISFFFSNLRDKWSSKDLWFLFARYGAGLGRIADVFIPGKTDKRGGRFGFVKFKEVKDVKAMLQKLNMIWLGSFKLRVSLAKEDAGPSNYWWVHKSAKFDDKEDDESIFKVDSDFDENSCFWVGADSNDKEQSLPNEEEMKIRDQCARDGSVGPNVSLGKSSFHNSLSVESQSLMQESNPLGNASIGLDVSRALKAGKRQLYISRVPSAKYRKQWIPQ